MDSIGAQSRQEAEIPIHLQPLKICDKPEDVLRKMLSTRFVMSGASIFVTQYHEALRGEIRREKEQSDAARSQASSIRTETRLIRSVGWGSCGVVYEQLGTTHVLKRAKARAELSENCKLLNDLVMHKAVEETFHRVTEEGLATQVRVPRLYSYMSRSDRVCWSTHAQLFPEGDRTPEDLLLSERIPPLHLVARQALIDLYCPEHLKAGAKFQASNDDCLVRLYLGKRRDPAPLKKERRFFGLRNFPLCLEQMEDLKLDTSQYALAIAEALAVMHWKTKIDAADVEFVLGGPPCLTHVPLPTSQQMLEFQGDAPITSAVSDIAGGATHIWLLDFNQCQPLQMDESGVDRAVKRFFDNDPYFPRPPIDSESRDIQLWETFESQYLAISQRLVAGKERALPALFIEKVKKANIKRLEMMAEAAQRSDSYSIFEAESRLNDPEKE